MDVTNLWAILIETLEADPLGQGYTGNSSGLGAGYVAEASWKEILRYLCGFPTACVPCHHNHRVTSNQLHYLVPILEDGQVFLVPAKLGKFAKTLSLAEVQEMQERQAAVWDLLTAKSRASMLFSVLRLSQTLLDIPGAHRYINAIASIIVYRKAKIYLSSSPLVLPFFFVLFQAWSSWPRHVPLCFKPLEAVKESPELFVLRAACLDVIMLAEKDFIHLSSALWTIPVPTPAFSPVRIHSDCKPYSAQR